MANRCFQLSIEGVLLSSYRQTTLHFQSSGTNDNDTLAAAESLANGFNASIMALFLATLPASYDCRLLAARRVGLKPSAVGKHLYIPGDASGSRGSDATSQQCCPSIFLVPTMGVKSGGRIFWPAVPEGDLFESTYSAGWQTAVDAAIAAMISGFTLSGITWTLCVYSRKLNTISNIASHHYSPVIGFQGRRRKPAGAV